MAQLSDDPAYPFREKVPGCGTRKAGASRPPSRPVPWASRPKLRLTSPPRSPACSHSRPIPKTVRPTAWSVLTCSTHFLSKCYAGSDIGDRGADALRSCFAANTELPTPNAEHRTIGALGLRSLRCWMLGVVIGGWLPSLIWPLAAFAPVTKQTQLGRF
jgi:hypothetical protein